jgi:K+-sensing histidine kinase KdpD
MKTARRHCRASFDPSLGIVVSQDSAASLATRANVMLHREEPQSMSDKDHAAHQFRRQNNEASGERRRTLVSSTFSVSTIDFDSSTGGVHLCLTTAVRVETDADGFFLDVFEDEAAAALVRRLSKAAKL